jgi:hypothetical protein
VSLPPYANRLQYLLRADAGTYQNTAGSTPATANGDPVALWTDQSGNGGPGIALIASTAATLATNAINTTLPAVVFTGTPQYHFTQAFINLSRTIYYVVKSTNAGNSTLLCGSGSVAVDCSLQVRFDNLKPRLVDTGKSDIGFATSAMPSGVWTQGNISWDGQNAVFRQAGAANGTLTAASVQAYGATRYFGQNVFAGGEYLAGSVALVMEYADIHTLAQSQAVEAWINGIWGV